MCCTLEQIVSNPNHNIGADVSTSTHTHTVLYLSYTQQTRLEVLTCSSVGLGLFDLVVGNVCTFSELGELSKTHIHMHTHSTLHFTPVYFLVLAGRDVDVHVFTGLHRNYTPLHP